MKVFSLDVETTTANKGNPFNENNHLVLGAIGTSTSYITFTSGTLGKLQETLDQSRLVVLFNAKFDLHWIRRIGIKFDIRMPVWDCQLAEFILSNQQWKYPSLDGACANRGLPRKLDIVKTEYWEKGIDTDQIPFEILDEYLRGDITSTYLLYLDQLKEFQKPENHKKYKLFRLQCYDLMVLQEMEYNGYKFDVEKALAQGKEIQLECARIESAVAALYPDVPINLSSPDHISCMLYGGTITDTIKVPVGVYKTGARAGEVKYKNMDQPYILPRMIEPLKGSGLSKEGYFATNEDTLMTLPAKGTAKKIITLLLERRGLEKLRGTYYEGIPSLIQDHCWPNQIVHGNLNQCVASTSRLSATKPNQQNMSGSVKQLCISRYNE